MATRDAFSDAGIDAEDLSAAIRAITRFDREAGKEIKRAIRTHSKPILARARGHVAGSRGTHKRVRGTAVALSVTNKGAALKLKPSVSPLAWATEFGMIAGGMVPRRVGAGRGFATRYSRPYGGEGESFLAFRGFYGTKILSGNKGLVMGRAVREGMPRFERDVMDDIDDLMDAIMDSAGVPRKGRS